MLDADSDSAGLAQEFAFLTGSQALPLIQGPHWESKATLCVSPRESEQMLRNSCEPENWGRGGSCSGVWVCAECLRGAAGTGGAAGRAPGSRWGLGSVVTKEMSLENFLLILSIRADDGPRM